MYHIDEGILYYETENEDQDQDHVVVGNEIQVSKLYIDGESGEIEVELQFYFLGRCKKKKLSRSKINKNSLLRLADFGLNIQESNAKHYIAFVNELLSEEGIEEKIEYQHNALGWSQLNDADVFNLDRSIGSDECSSYKGYKKIKPIGDYCKWKEMIETQVLGRPLLELSLAIGFSGPLVKIMQGAANLETLFVNFDGDSSKGKTTATKLAVSPWGYPDTDSGLILQYSATDNFILNSLSGNHGIPLVIDDTSTKSVNSDFSTFIYRLASGRDRGRLNANGTKQEMGTWATTIVSSSEISMLANVDSRQGIRARLLEISGDFTDASAHADLINEVVMNNYGHGGIQFIERLITKERKEIYRDWIEAKTELIGRISNSDSITARIAGKLALIYLGAKYANEALGINLNLDGVKNTLIELENKSVTNRESGTEAYESLKEHFISNKHKFCCNKEVPGNKSLIGKYILDGNRITEIWFLADAFKNILEKKGKYLLMDVIKSLQQQNLLITDKKKSIIQRVFQPGMDRVSFYAIKLRDPIIEGEKEDISECILDKMPRKAVATPLKLVGAKKEFAAAPKFSPFADSNQSDNLGTKKKIFPLPKTISMDIPETKPSEIIPVIKKQSETNQFLELLKNGSVS